MLPVFPETGAKLAMGWHFNDYQDNIDFVLSELVLSTVSHFFARNSHQFDDSG